MKRSFLLAGLLLLSAVGVASAQTTSTFVQVSGITGSSTDPKHLGWSNAISLGQNIAVNLPSSTGGPGGVVPVACSVLVAKSLDSATPQLWNRAAEVRTISEVNIEVVRADGTVSYAIRLTGVNIVSILTSTGATLTESITFKAQNTRLTVFLQNAAGGPAGNVQSNFSC